MNGQLGGWTAAWALGLALAGCGGGGGDSGKPLPGPSAEGIYTGSLSGSTSSAFQGLVLENDEFWAMYGTQTASAFVVAGFVQGAGSSNAGSFSSSSTKDFAFLPPLVATTSATYSAPAKTITGTLTYANTTVRFNGGPVVGSLYDYAAAPSLTTVAGAWPVNSLAGERINLSIAGTGTVVGTSSLGCNLTGTVTPRPSGKNVFNVSLTFGAAPCFLAGQTATGIALAYPLAGGKTQLLVAVTNAARTAGTAIVGTR